MSDPSDTEGPPSRVPTWEEIARDHGRFLYTVAYRLTGNHDDAQDLVQEVLLRVRRGLATYRPGSLEGWLSRITTNAFLDEVRRRKRRPLEVVPDLPERAIGVDADPEEVLGRSRLPDDVQDAIRALPEDFRAAVVLCDVVGLDYAEIARQPRHPAGHRPQPHPPRPSPAAQGVGVVNDASEHLDDVLSAYLDDELTPAERVDVEAHLAGCAECRSDLDAEAEVRLLVRELPAVDPPFGFYERILRDGPAAAPAPDAQAPAAVRAGQHRRHRGGVAADPRAWPTSTAAGGSVDPDDVDGYVSAHASLLPGLGRSSEPRSRRRRAAKAQADYDVPDRLAGTYELVGVVRRRRHTRSWCTPTASRSVSMFLRAGTPQPGRAAQRRQPVQVNGPLAWQVPTSQRRGGLPAAAGRRGDHRGRRSRPGGVGRGRLERASRRRARVDARPPHRRRRGLLETFGLHG